MINIKAVILALLISLAIPVQPAGSIRHRDSFDGTQGWWSMLYPEYCGIADSLENTDGKKAVSFKIAEILAKAVN